MGITRRMVMMMMNHQAYLRWWWGMLIYFCILRNSSIPDNLNPKLIYLSTHATTLRSAQGVGSEGEDLGWGIRITGGFVPSLLFCSNQVFFFSHILSSKHRLPWSNWVLYELALPTILIHKDSQVLLWMNPHPIPPPFTPLHTPLSLSSWLSIKGELQVESQRSTTWAPLFNAGINPHLQYKSSSAL